MRVLSTTAATHARPIDPFRSSVNLTEPDFRVVVARLTATLWPVGPYPILILKGEQSSDKSTLARTLKVEGTRKSRL